MKNNIVTLDDGITINTVIEETQDNFNVLQDKRLRDKVDKTIKKMFHLLHWT